MTDQTTILSLMEKHFFHFGVYKNVVLFFKSKPAKWSFVICAVSYIIMNGAVGIWQYPSAVQWRAAVPFLLFVGIGVLCAIDRMMQLVVLRRICERWRKQYFEQTYFSYKYFQSNLRTTKWWWAV